MIRQQIVAYKADLDRRLADARVGKDYEVGTIRPRPTLEQLASLKPNLPRAR
jgi:ABC-type Fe3+-citrate transport system substrate-binding protein